MENEETKEVKEFIDRVINGQRLILQKQTLENRLDSNILIGKVQGYWKVIDSAKNGDVVQMIKEHSIELATYDSIYIVDIRNPSVLIKYDKDTHFVDVSKMYR